MFEDFVPCHKCEYYDTEKCYCSLFLMRKALGCPEGEKKKPKTHGDEIRAMTDEELAGYMAAHTNKCPPMKCTRLSLTPCPVEECWLDYLREEVDHAGTETG